MLYIYAKIIKKYFLPLKWSTLIISFSLISERKVTHFPRGRSPVGNTRGGFWIKIKPREAVVIILCLFILSFSHYRLRQPMIAWRHDSNCGLRFELVVEAAEEILGLGHNWGHGGGIFILSLHRLNLRFPGMAWRNDADWSLGLELVTQVVKKVLSFSLTGRDFWLFFCITRLNKS